MDYDDNDFQSQNPHLAGEGSNKFPPVLRPYALTKFDFDDSFHGPLRFDSLVETEVFLGIESNEDNQWIEDFSRGSGGIQFSSSAAGSGTLSRHNNVWSEAASSESVEMLLKSVGQEEIVPVQTNSKESDACDELSCMIKPMEHSLKEDTTTQSKVGDATDVQSVSQPGEVLENVSLLDNNDVGQQPPVDNMLETHKRDASVDGSLGDLTALSVEVELGDSVVNKSLDNRKQEVSASGMEVEGAVNPAQHVFTSKDELNNEGASSINETTDNNVDVLETDNGEHLEVQHVSSEEVQRDDQILDVSVMKGGPSNLEETNTMESNISDVEGPSCTAPKRISSLSEDLQVGDQSGVNMHEVSVRGIESHVTFDRNEIEGKNGSPMDNNDLVSKPEASLLSAEDNMASKDKVDGGNSRCKGDNSSLTAVLSSSEFSDRQFEGHVASPILTESTQMFEKNIVLGRDEVHKHDQDFPAGERESADLASGGNNAGSEVAGSLIISRRVESLSSGEGSTENELTVSKLQPNAAAGSESVTTGNGITSDAVADHKVVEISPLPSLGLTHSDKEEEIAAKISTEGNLSDSKTSSLVTTGLDPVSESEKGASSHPAAQMFCDSANQSVSMLDACNIETQMPQAVVINKVSQECTKEMEMYPALCGASSNKGDGGEAPVKENDEKASSKFSEPIVTSNKMLGPESSAMQESCEDTSQKDLGKNEAVIVSADMSYKQIAVPSTNECGSCGDLDKLASGSPTVIRNTEASQNETGKEGVTGSSGQSVSVSDVNAGGASKAWSVSLDPRQNDASKDERSFTFVVSPPVDMTQKEADKKWQPFSTLGLSNVSPIADGSASTSGLGQLDPKVAQDLSHGSPKVSDAVTVRSGSKGSSGRKTRRSSSKATVKETAKKGTHAKEAAAVRLERGNKMNVSLSPSVISQLVQSNEMQHYGHVDPNSMKPFVLASSTSGLPDLNSSASSAVFQQPFTDLQQVQLRAQIFVYGALIQGTAPDEAYMISAFGGPDGGRSIWENAWRLCIDRLHGQKSHLITPETPLQPRSGVRAPDPATKQSAVQSKAICSPAGRGSSKVTPPPIVNTMAPLSSPLWSIPTPSGDALQPSGMPRVPVMDYQRALSPLHPHQTPPIRNFVGHNSSWMSQTPFCGPWAASPQTSLLDASGRFSVQLPITEAVQLTPVKESSVPYSSGAKHVPPGPVSQSGTSAGVLAGHSPATDVKKVTVSSDQPSADPKPRKRKKTSVSENPSQNILHPQPQTESVTAPIMTGNLSTSIAVTTPVNYVSKVPTEKFITSVSPTSSIDLGKGEQNAERKAILSEETLVKVKEARVQAEDAAVFAAAAVTHSQEIWNQLNKQRNSGLLPDVKTKMASAAAAIAAAAAVAKAAAAAANVASNAALQAKLMADEAVSIGYSDPGQSNVISFSDGLKDLGKATPASILNGDDRTNGSSSILVAAKEAARRRVEAASAASKRAENMDAIVKAAELAAEAVSQAGKIVAMGDPLPVSELVATGPEGYWRVNQANSELVSKSNDVGRENLNIDSVGEGPDTSSRHLKEGPSDKKDMQVSKSASPTEMSNDDHMRLVDVLSGSVTAGAKDAKGHKIRKASDLSKTIGVVPEPENGSRALITVQNESEKAVETLKGNTIKDGSHVEVFKDGSGFKAAWFSANVLSLKDGKAYVNYNDLASGEGLEKLKEWVSLKGEGDEAPRIRVARPVTAMPFEGTRKRRRAAMGDYTWSVGDRVDAWIQDRWWEGFITEKNKKDETMLTVQFPAQGETSVVSAWHLRPSLIWKDGEWIEWSSSRESNGSSHGGDTPQEKRPRVQSPAVEVKGKDKMSKSTDAMQSDKPYESTLLDISADDKLFNIGKSTRDENKSDTLRMTRTGLQKEGSRVVFGVPKPGKKRKFMEVSRHYVGDQSGKMNEANDSAKFAKYLMPQGSGSRGWKNTSKTELNDKRATVSKPKVLKSGKPQNVSTRTIPQKDNLPSTEASAHADGSVMNDNAKIKDSVSHVENTSGKHNLMGIQSFSSSVGGAEAPILFSSLSLPSDTVASKKTSTSNAKSERVSKGKLAPAGGKLGKIEEDTVFNGNSAKSTSDVVEPRRSNRRIQPTSRLLEGLQSSLMVSKIPSVSHDKSHKSRHASRGNGHG